MKSDIEVFLKELLDSNKKGRLTDYCLMRWDEALSLLNGDSSILDELSEKANESIDESNDSIYWNFANELLENKVDLSTNNKTEE